MDNKKRCPSCETVKLTVDFYNNKSRKDGKSTYCKSCIKIDCHNYYLRKKEERLEYQRKWRQENREYSRERERRYREENRQLHRDKDKRYRKNNKEKIRKKNKRYRQANLDYFLNKNRERRGRKLATSDGSITQEFEDMLYEHQEGKCNYCSVDLNTVEKHLDHIVPLSRGGAHISKNVQWLCYHCNTSKGSKLEEEWLDELDK